MNAETPAAAPLLCVMALVAGTTLVIAQSSPRLEIVPVVGHWEHAGGGESAVTSDPRKWDGRSGPNLDAVARSLFADPRPVFAKNAAPATAFPLAVVKSVETFSEGTLRVRFKLVGGEPDQTAGLAFGIGPAADYVYVRYNTKDGNLAVWEFVDGARKVLMHGAEHVQLPLDTWHELTVRIAGRRVTGTVNGKLKVEHDLAQPVSGRVGFWAKRDAVSAFKDFVVQP
jgi:hypothetical protein